eukprot:TRINITY_DN3294_c0_g1_i2.p1 TRINITY_DN3294_c0_g1~~TRINITY_DN3294_c0_g1_i2.p1  ORF type:complete len:400 (+),score=108.18 TRINITY_DN3294_c0_g1_i2:28-1227(+)
MAFAVLSPVARWYWKDETGTWKPYEDVVSDAIEGAYATNQPFVVIGNKYRVNVPARQQSNLASNFSRTVLRGTWFWQDNPGTYIPYPEGVAARLESAFLSNQFDIPIPVDNERHVILKPDMVSSRQLRNTAPRGTVLTARVVCRGYMNQLCQAQNVVQQTVVQQAQPAMQTVIHQQPQPAMQTIIQQPQPAMQTIVQQPQPLMQPLMAQPQQTVVQQTQMDPGMQGGMYQPVISAPQPQQMYAQMMDPSLQQGQPQQMYAQMMATNLPPQGQPQVLPQQTLPQQQFLPQQQLQPQQQMFPQQQQLQPQQQQVYQQQQQMFPQQQLQPQQQQQMFPQQQPQQQQMYQQQLQPQQQQGYSAPGQYAPLATTLPQSYPVATNQPSYPPGQVPQGYPPNYNPQ